MFKKCSSVLLITLSLYSSFTMAAQQDTINILSDKEIKLLNQLNFDNRTSPELRKEKIKFADKLKKKVLLEDIKDSGSYVALIKKYSTLIHVNSQQEFILPQDIHVRLFHAEDEQGYKYIAGKNNKIRFKVKDYQVTSIGNITDMSIYPKTYNEDISKNIRKRLEYTNKPMLTHQFNIHAGAVYAPFLKDVLVDNATIGYMGELEYALLVKTASRIEIGGEVVYQNTSVAYDLDTVSITTAAIGPKFRFQLGSTNKKETFLQTGFLKSFSSQMTYTPPGTLAGGEAENLKINTPSNTFNLGLETHYETILVGVNYRRIWYNLENSDVLPFQTSSSKTAIGIDLYLGFQL